MDSGSPYCLFRADVAASIGLRDLASGVRGEIGSVTGERDVCYFHKVKLYVENSWMIEVTAAFPTNLAVPAILGRLGFFDNFLVTFDHALSPPALVIERFEKPQ